MSPWPSTSTIASITIEQQQLDRWELTIDQVAAAALANLRRVVGTWHGRVNEEEFDGIPVRTLKGWPVLGDQPAADTG